MTKNVVFDEASAERIARAVKIVESWGESLEEPFVEEPVQALPADRMILQGTFEGAWNVGETKTVQYVADNGDNKEKNDVENPIADAGADGETTACIILRVGPKWILGYAEAGETVCRELSLVEPSAGMTLLSQVSPTGTVLQSLSGTVVTGVACVNGNLTVTTASLASLSTSASLSSLVGYTQKTVRLSDLATVTTQNLTLPKQEGCS